MAVSLVDRENRRKNHENKISITFKHIDIHTPNRNGNENGKHLGTAFQLADDILDYTADSDEMGKNAGDDLAEGKPTLPLLYAMWHTENDDDKALIRDAIENSNGLPHLSRIQQIMAETGAIDYTLQRANEEVAMAVNSLSALPDSDYKSALIALANMSVERSS